MLHPLRLSLLLSMALLAGCGDGAGEAASASALVIDTGSEDARRQHDVNLAFARNYQARCPTTPASRPRLLLTGFVFNATGSMVGEVVPEAKVSGGFRGGGVVAPATQLGVGSRLLRLPGVDADVEVCALTLPVAWDLAAVLVLRELDAFAPNFVMMNGIGGAREKVWLELGAMNAALVSEDGTNTIRPAGDPSKYVPLVPSASADEYLRPNLLSWAAVQNAGRDAIAKASRRGGFGVSFDDVVFGVTLAGFPRGGNSFVCNNITYTVGYVMDHPEKATRLLESSRGDAGVDVRLSRDYSAVPRVFVHWPFEIAPSFVGAGSDVLKAMAGAQLGALARGDQPTRGENAAADPTLRGGSSY
ncbi:MAG: hypothetical protein IPG50_38610 [Myxococcales bacterium]|nr:hypothetical protein [Myxococcales bacterium]